MEATLSDVSDKLSLEDESYAMVNLSPRMTGLSRHVFVSPRMGSHDVQGESRAGQDTLPVNCAVIGLLPAVQQIVGPTLPGDVLAEVARWIAPNTQPIIIRPIIPAVGVGLRRHDKRLHPQVRSYLMQRGPKISASVSAPSEARGASRSRAIRPATLLMKLSRLSIS